jgi:hypothetical protein
MQTMLIQGGNRTLVNSIPFFSADTLFWSYEFIWFNQGISTVCSMHRICYCCDIISAHGHTSIKSSKRVDMRNDISTVHEFRHSDCICV